MTSQLRGILTVLNTPFTNEDTLDEEALRAHVAYARTAGVAGFLVPAMASEVSKLSQNERLRMLEIVVAEAGATPVIGGASAATPYESADTARAMRDRGCQGILVSIPYHNDAQYEADLRIVAAVDPPFLMVQDWASDSYGVPEALLTRLFHEIPCFKCLKVEVAPAGVKYSAMLRATNSELHVSGGWAVTQMIEALDRGVHAFMPTGLHHAYTRICRLYDAGDRDAARALHESLLPILSFSNQHLDISIHFFKRLLHAQGIYPTPRVRDPILPFDPTHERFAAELIERAISIEKAAAAG